jgi:hypothetical protein
VFDLIERSVGGEYGPVQLCDRESSEERMVGPKGSMSSGKSMVHRIPCRHRFD